MTAAHIALITTQWVFVWIAGAGSLVLLFGPRKPSD